MRNDEKDIDEKRPRPSDSSDRDAKRATERNDQSKDDYEDIGTDAQQADGSAAGPSTS
jgi:hypothetical protein